MASHSTPSDGQHESRMRECIVGYLAERPEAGDTLKGIACFWVMLVVAREMTPLVEQVVQELVESGVLEATPVKGGETLYRLRQAGFPE